MTPGKRRAGAGRGPLDAMPRAHKLQQGKELHLPYFLSAWKLRRFPSCKGSSVPKNFSKAMTSFQDRTVYGGGEPGLIIGTGKGARGVWKSSTFPAAGSRAARPRPSLTVGAPERVMRGTRRYGRIKVNTSHSSRSSPSPSCKTHAAGRRKHHTGRTNKCGKKQSHLVLRGEGECLGILA